MMKIAFVNFAGESCKELLPFSCEGTEKTQTTSQHAVTKTLAQGGVISDGNAF